MDEMKFNFVLCTRFGKRNWVKRSKPFRCTIKQAYSMVEKLRAKHDGEAWLRITR